MFIKSVFNSNIYITISTSTKIIFTGGCLLPSLGKMGGSCLERHLRHRFSRDVSVSLKVPHQWQLLESTLRSNFL